MPAQKIPIPSWLGILTKFGITAFGQFQLSDTVVPVALVDSEITLSAIAQAPLYAVPASAGELVAPVAATRLADTGALAAGNYSALVYVANRESIGTPGAPLRIRRRNAADAADIWSQQVSWPGSTIQTFQARFSMAQNERLVVELVSNATAGITYQGSIFLSAG